MYSVRLDYSLKLFIMKVKFKDWSCVVEKHKYTSTNGIALRLVDAEDGSPVATATICIPEIPIKSDEVIIKNYSENDGMVVALVRAKIIDHPHQTIKLNQYGNVGYLCKYLEPKS
jgi:non-homologous end joining protein Ku